jgi:hypothetical protein
MSRRARRLATPDRALPPLQNVVGPPGVMVGVGGFGLIVTTVAAEGALLQEPGVVATVEIVSRASRVEWGSRWTSRVANDTRTEMFTTTSAAATLCDAPVTNELRKEDGLRFGEKGP